MSDLNPVQSTTPVIIIGSDLNGAETTPVESYSDGSLSTAVRSRLIEVAGTGNALNSTPITSTDCSYFTQILIQILGTFSATMTFEGSNNNLNWVSVNAQTVSNATTASVQTANANGLFVVPILFKYFRLRISTYSSGTVSATAEFTTLAGVSFGQRVTAAVQSGTWSTRLQDGSGTSVTVGQKVMTSSLPVVIASNQTAIPVSELLTTGGVEGVLAVGTTAVEAKVGVSQYPNRKLVTVLPKDGNLYWGYTSSVTIVTGTKIFKNQEKSFSSAIPIWLISSGSVSVSITEGA